MKSFLFRALGVSALLASHSAQAHSHPTMPKGLHLPAAHIEREVKPVLTYSDVVGLRSERTVVALASPFTGPTPRASFSAPRVSTSFRSTPSYRSFSPTPSRTYSFSRASSPSASTRPAATSAPRTYNFSQASSPSTSTRPATTSAPRTYTYSISGVQRTKTYTPAPSSQPAEVHHYHPSGSGGGGLSATEVILLNQALNNNNSHQSQAYSDAGAIGRYVSSDSETAQLADSGDEGISGWGIFGIVVLCLGIAGAVCFAVHRLVK
jgi:hypothetical protein